MPWILSNFVGYWEENLICLNIFESWYFSFITSFIKHFNCLEKSNLRYKSCSYSERLKVQLQINTKSDWKHPINGNINTWAQESMKRTQKKPARIWFCKIYKILRFAYQKQLKTLNNFKSLVKRQKTVFEKKKSEKENSTKISCLNTINFCNFFKTSCVSGWP